MVNFNNEATISTSPGDIVKITILQRRYDVLEALESYKKLHYQGIKTSPSFAVKSRIFTLYIEVKNMLERSMKEEELLKLNDLIKSDDVNDLITAFYLIDGVLDDKHIIRIDIRKKFDTTNVETENIEKGL